MSAPKLPYRDLHAHLDELERQGLLLRIDRPIDKDAELHPLVRWQFVGGMVESERKAFLFTHVIDGHGRKYDLPVVVGALAANRAIYSVGMDAPVDAIQAKWDRAIAAPIAPRVVTEAPCQEIVHTGAALQGVVMASIVCPFRSRHRALIAHRRSPRPTSSPVIRKRASKTWAPTALR